MTLTSSHAEDTCLNNQASSPTARDSATNVAVATTPTAVSPLTTTATTTTTSRFRTRSRANTATASAPATPAGQDVSVVDYFTLGSGVVSGHHYAYLPDPWVARSPNAVAGSSSSSSRADAAYSDEKPDVDVDADAREQHDGLVAGAARFGSGRRRGATASSAAAAQAAQAAANVAGSPSSASASSVSAVGSVAASNADNAANAANATQPLPDKEAADAVPVLAPVRLVRTVTFGHVTDIDRRPRSAYSIESAAPSLSSEASEASSSSSASSASSASDVDRTPFLVTFPEGGLQAWLVVFASFCAMVSVFGLISTAAVFESWFSTHQLAEYSASEIGWVFSLYLFFVFFIGIQVGPLFDRYGPRWLVATGSVLVVASVLLLGLCQTYYQILLCYSVLGGLGGALLNTPAYACIAHFFNARRGLATGIATTSGGVGGIVFPLLLQQLLPRLGFAWSTRILGLILLVLSVPANLWLRTRLPLPGVVAKRDEADAETAHTPSVRSGRSSVLSSRVPSVWPDFSIFRDRRYAVAAVGIFFMEWGIFVPLTFIVSYASAHGQDTTHAYTMLSLLNAGSVLGRFLPGLLADRIGRFNVIIVTIALSSAVVLGVWLPAADSVAVLTVFAVLFGFASGSNLGLIAVCLGQLCEPSEYGRYYSTAMMVASFGTLSSVPIGGAILGNGVSDAGWLGLISFSGVAYALALVCYIAARVMAVGWNPRVKF